MEQAIDDAMVDHALRAERARQASVRIAAARKRFVGLGLLVCVPALTALLHMRVSGAPVVEFRMTAPTIADRAEAEEALAEVVEDVRSFRDDYAQLPDSLAETGRPTRGTWRYTKSTDGSFQLKVTFHGHDVGFNGR